MFVALSKLNWPFRIVAALFVLGVLSVTVERSFAEPPAAKVAGTAEFEWPQQLGPHRNGLSTETGLLDQWPADGPKVVWRVPGGVGMSGLAISRGRLVTMVQHTGQQWVIALDVKTGKSLWKTSVAETYRNSMGDGPRATPTIAGDRVFVFTGEGRLAALDFNDGAKLWTRDPMTDLSSKEAEYGMASSPLVIDDQVIVTIGAEKGTLAAFNTKTGEPAWTAGQDPAGYSSPTLLTIDGRPQIVSFTGSSALGIAPRTGKLLWRYPFETNFDCNIVMPISIKGRVLLSAGENHGSVLLDLKPQADQFEPVEVWKSFGTKSVLRSEWQTPVFVDGYLYGMDNVGGAGPVTHLTCVEAATGKRRWQVPRFGKGNLIAADSKLFMSTMAGELVVARTSPKKYDEMGRITVLETTRQAPSLANGFLYLRDGKEIICLDVRK